MNAIMTSAAPADNSWSIRFDSAQQRYRESLRNRVAQKTTADSAIVSTPAETDAEWFERFGAELDAVEARGGLLAQLIAPVESFADDLVNAVACTECRDDRDVPADEPESDPADWPAWTDEFTVSDPLSIDELLRGVPHFGEDGPARHATSDEVASAWWNGYQLGESGYEVDQVSPPQHMTGREATAFIEGVASGADERWTAYGLWLEQQDALARMFDPFAEVNEAELSACGCR